MIHAPKVTELIERYGLLVLLAGIIIFFGVDSNTEQFLTTANFTNIFSSQAVGGIIAIATILPLVAGHFDLSIGANTGFIAVLSAGLMSKTGTPLAAAIAIGIVAGALIGVVNGFLVAKLRLNSIVATLGMSSLLAAAVQWYSKGITISTGVSQQMINFGTDKWFGIPSVVYVLAAAALFAWYLLEHTPVGRYLYAAGVGERAATLVGIPVERLTFASFVAAGTLAAVAGELLLAIQGGADPAIGPSFTLPAVAAVFLGATAIKPGRYNVWGTMSAVFFLAISVNGLTLLGAEAWVGDLYNGAALIAAVAIAKWANARRTRLAGPDIDNTGSINGHEGEPEDALAPREELI
jgi:ribose transport system permease protein